MRVTRTGGSTTAPGVLHGAFTAGGTPAAGAALRRPPGAVRGHRRTHDAAAGPRGPGRAARAGDRTSATVLPSLRRKPVALLNWIWRDGLFPRDAYRRTLEALLEDLDDRRACRRMVDLLALAHDHCCEARLAAELDAWLDAGQLPDPAVLREHFLPKPDPVPDVDTPLPPMAEYDGLAAAAPADHAGTVAQLHRARRPGGLALGAPARHACSPRRAATRSPTASAGASSATGPRRSCRPAGRSTTSTSPLSWRSRRRASACWRPGTPGSGRPPTCCLFGPPGTGKSHLAAGLGAEARRERVRVLYQRTANLVQKLQTARRDLALEAAIRKPYKYHLLILEDFS